MWTDYDLQVIDLNKDPSALDEILTRKILDFASRHDAARLKNYEIALFRTYCIESGHIGMLRQFYMLQYPREFSCLALDDPSLFLRLKAYFAEDARKTDSAFIYFQMAEQKILADPNRLLKSRFYNRFGEFLLRHGRNREAAEKYARSLELAGNASYLDYMVNATRKLTEIYASNGDFREAYRYSVLNKSLSDSINNMSKKDQFLVMEIDHETRRREMMVKQEKEETDRRHYLQYSAMVVGILTVFVLLIMLGSLRVPAWIIRMLGFFSFIFLFEFIVLLADHRIEELTHGEPWKVLLIKIFLIAILLPMHHKIEKSVITYLLNHRLIDVALWPAVKRRISGLRTRKTQ